MILLGMRARGKVNTDELTYLGPKSYSNVASLKRKNRRQAGCLGARNNCVFDKGNGESCDEVRAVIASLLEIQCPVFFFTFPFVLAVSQYPFASSKEGGIDEKTCLRARKQCVPAHQNSKQGWIWSKYLNALRQSGAPLQPGDTFRVVIDPSFDCSAVPNARRSLSAAEEQLFKRSAPYQGAGSSSMLTTGRVVLPY
jgi:hypothetical protein